ncbi:MAG TPA: hypothetical protein VHI75_12420, partial [Casimicrobiaceae bacterium]|nr:hypothetical protein [Casimicrobiaceae bacterium]
LGRRRFRQDIKRWIGRVSVSISRNSHSRMRAFPRTLQRGHCYEDTATAVFAEGVGEIVEDHRRLAQTHPANGEVRYLSAPVLRGIIRLLVFAFAQIDVPITRTTRR